MNFKYLIAGLIFMVSPPSMFAFDIAMVPLHSYAEQLEKPYGNNISLHGTPTQINNLKRWISIISRVPKGLDTLIKIQNSQHKLFFFQSPYSMISSGRTSAPLSANLTNGKGEAVDIYFNAEIPDTGSHRVLDTSGQPIEYTAVQNLFHELSHAKHMMNGSWRYFKSEIQAIEEENIFRQQLAEIEQQPFYERVYVEGKPICPKTSEPINSDWFQEIICTANDPSH